jgi:tetratricopeptide (TPR) repeat protein
MTRVAVLSFAVFSIVASIQPAQAQVCDNAVVAFKAGKIEQAAQLARECIDSGTVSGDAYKLLAISYFLLQRFDDYLVNMQRAAELNPADAEIHYHLGRFYYEAKDYTKAMDRFSRAVELDPDNYKASYFLALCKQGNSDEKGAAEGFRKAISIIDRKRIRYGWPFADLGDMLALKGDYEGGLSWAYRAIRNDPSLPYVHYVYARVLMNKEPTPEVEQELDKAIKLDPGYTQAYFLLGRYYTKVGDKEKAKVAYAKFNELKANPVPSPFGVRRQ